MDSISSSGSETDDEGEVERAFEGDASESVAVGDQADDSEGPATTKKRVVMTRRERNEGSIFSFYSATLSACSFEYRKLRTSIVRFYCCCCFSLVICGILVQLYLYSDEINRCSRTYCARIAA